MVDMAMIALKSLLKPAKRGCALASITIRNLDDGLKRRLRIRAAEHGRSMEEEARDILRLAMAGQKPCRNLAASIRARIAPLGGVELDIPIREPVREPPKFNEKI